MSEEVMTHGDDASHYEVSLTAAQAFVAFVLLLLSLAASFAFGVIIGKGQVDDRLVVRHDPTVVNEGGTTGKNSNNSKIVELGVQNDAFAHPATTTDTAATATSLDESAQVDLSPNTTGPAENISQASSLSNPPHAPSAANSVATTPAVIEAPRPVTPAPAASSATGPWFAQLLSTSDVKTAESLAARLIDGGFKNAYVERTATDKGMIYRVRVKFDSEASARASVDTLRSYSKGDAWVTKQ